MLALADKFVRTLEKFNSQLYDQAAAVASRLWVQHSDPDRAVVRAVGHSISLALVKMEHVMHSWPPRGRFLAHNSL